jgi:cell division transport system permease protein
MAGNGPNALRQGLHLLGQGFKGLTVSPGQTVACVLSLAVAGCLVVLSASFGSLTVDVLDRAGRSAKVLVYLKDEVPAERVQDLMTRVGARSDVEAVEYLTREQDRAHNADLLPRDVMATLPAEAVPGQHGLEVTFRAGAGGTAGIGALASFLKALEGVDVVAEPPVGSGRLRALAAAVGFLRTVLMMLAALLLVGTLFFVVGTLTRTMERRKDEMNILRLLGATDAFVRAPIVIQGVLQGVAGLALGSIAAILVSGAVNAWLSVEFDVAVRLPAWPGRVLPLAVAGGLLLGVAGAFIATARREA